ncbi:MerR family transcriptional regulator [Janthinobacterium psychrotolerans]|uniref:DNA-binding transcriptional regulator, MerR family n=1 Tax=Janthinobacterium psychrotolerans TaxID=1747903 RepID=A0A1A7C4Z2_9BURK|nr:MerR family transcriptional regulator [Janthinobacterium psychrotolerans]OBV40772.1 DNA-binding transcriptional regulator, MerR family [Janthinobacterium psychrotolerans]
MQIGDMAQATGLSRDTLRYYEKRGLLRAARSANGYRDYPPEAVGWLRYLRTAQELGFTLAEIEADMPLLAAPDTAETAALLRAALARKLHSIDARIAALAQLRGELARRLGEQMQDCPLRGAQDAAT